PAAEAVSAELRAAGLDARVVKAEAPEGVRYRVRLGPYATRDAARAVASRLASEHALRAFVTSR
ncbi:MAG TPA: SPOR domain-containing protein, partial [Candidatus Tectomicrobia bacterium]|nr:SPOR domain-containing protein [Candidatus Tectomicrobia bacterium]